MKVHDLGGSKRHRLLMGERGKFRRGPPMPVCGSPKAVIMEQSWRLVNCPACLGRRVRQAAEGRL